MQMAKALDTSKKLDKKGKKKVQSVAGTFIYYDRAVKSPILVTLNNIGTQQADPTENAMEEVTWLMDFLHTHPNAKLRFFAGNMQLAVDSNVAYLVLPGAKVAMQGFFTWNPTHIP